MTTLGYFLSCEEFHPNELVRQAVRAEAAGFQRLWISDHFHPWTDRQGHSPFVWSVIGALSQACSLPVTTAVTCPIMRIHPAVIAQAAATAAAQLDGRFALGVGTGEALNEHITGQHWPTSAVRRGMLEEAVSVIKELFTGEQVNHRGRYFNVENARLYTLPPEPAPIYTSGYGPAAAQLAGRIGELGQILPTPTHFDQASSLVPASAVEQAVPCGPDAKLYLDRIRDFTDAGFDEVYVQQIGPDQDRFFDFWESEVAPEFAA